MSDKDPIEPDASQPDAAGGEPASQPDASQPDASQPDASQPDASGGEPGVHSSAAPGPESARPGPGSPPGQPPRARRASDLAPLILGTILLLGGLIWLLGSIDFLGRFAIALIPLVVFGGLAAACVAAFRSAPEHRWGFLIPAGIFASIGVSVPAQMLHVLPDILFPLAFFSGPAVAFGYIYVLDTKRFWALVAGWCCMVLGATVFISELGRVGEIFGPLFMFAGVAVIFAWHYLTAHRDWAIFPAGLLVTLGLFNMVEELNLPDRVVTTVLLLGVSATCALYYLLARSGRTAWASVLSIVFAALGFLALISGSLLKMFLPILPIAFGVYLIVRSQREPDEEEALDGELPAEAPAENGS